MNATERQQARRRARQEKGLCIDCKKPVEEGLTRCLNHLAANAEAALKYYRGKKKQGGSIG